MDLASFYESAVANCRERAGQVRRRIGAVTVVRLGLFLLLALDLWYLFRGGQVWLAATALVLLAAFIASVNWYFRLKDKRVLWEKLEFVNENEKAVLMGRGNGFPDGKAFLEPDNYLEDLDVFGAFSVFHLLNRTTTFHGTGTLACWLTKSLNGPQAIRDQQDAVRVLAAQPDLRRLLIAKGLLTGDQKGDLRTLTGWLNTRPVVYPRIWLRISIALLTLANIAVLMYTLATGNWYPLVAAIVVARSITAAFGKDVADQHRLINHKQDVFSQYADVLLVFSGADPGGSGVVADLRSRAQAAHGAIRRLSRLTSFFDQRMNLMVNLVLNSLAFYDLQCMVGLERWKTRYRKEFPAWIEAVGQIEALNSLATFAFNNPANAWPVAEAAGDQGNVAPPSAIAADRPSVAAADRPSGVPSDGRTGGLHIEAFGLAHPLIPPAQRIANDFRIGREEKLILVTGSNMSGKTTFLRTVGVNLLLAQCGAPVCATFFSFTPMQLLTSLRISDSLQEQTSYFMAELKKLQRIVRQLETGTPAVVLIDEILRGTNSEDKTYGSEQFARKLAGYHCLSIFATHDLALGELETEMPAVVANYCFESVIEDGDLRFDYRLQRGIARNRNASFLMKKMGII